MKIILKKTILYFLIIKNFIKKVFIILNIISHYNYNKIYNFSNKNFFYV